MSIIVASLGPNSCYLAVSANESLTNVVASIKAQITVMGWTNFDDSANVFSAPVLGSAITKYVRLKTALINGYYYGSLIPYEGWNALTHNGTNPCYRADLITSTFDIRNGFKLTHNNSYKIYIFASSRWLAIACTQDNDVDGFEYTYSISLNSYQGLRDHVWENSSFSYTKFQGNLSGCFELETFPLGIVNTFPPFIWINTAVAFDIDTDKDASAENTINYAQFAAYRTAYAELRADEIGYAPRIKGSSVDFVGQQAAVCIAGSAQDTYMYRNAVRYATTNPWNNKYAVQDINVKTVEQMYFGRLHGLKLGQAGQYTWGQSVNVPCNANNFCAIAGSNVTHFALPVSVSKSWTYSQYHTYNDYQLGWINPAMVNPCSGNASYKPTFLIPL